MADRRPQDPTQGRRTRSNWKAGFSLTLSPREILHDINLITSQARESLTPEHGEPVKKRDSTSDSENTISDGPRNEVLPESAKNKHEKAVGFLHQLADVSSKERAALRIADINDRNEREAKKRTAKRIADINDRNERALKRAMNKEESEGTKPMQGEGSSKNGSRKSAAAKGRR